MHHNGQVDVWMMGDKNDNILYSPIASKIIKGATQIRFLPYAGAPVLAIVVEEKSRHRVQLWEIEKFEEGLPKNMKTFDLTMLK